MGRAGRLRWVRVPTQAAAATADLAALAGGTRSLVARWAGPAGRSPLKALALVATEGGGDVGAVMLPGDLLSSKDVAETLTEAMAGSMVGHQVKEVMRSLLPLGIDCTGLIMDTGVAAYLLDASTGEYELSDLRGDTGQLQLSMGDPEPELLDEAEAMVAEGATWPIWRRVSASRSTPSTWFSSTTASRHPWSGSWPKWKWPVSPSTGSN